MNNVLNKSTTENYRGLLSILIILHHLSLVLDKSFLCIFKSNGFLITSIFFFLSGYGNQKKYFNIKCKDYIKNKFKNLIIPYLLVVIIYIIFDKITYHSFYVSNMLGYVINKNPIVSNSWFVVVLILLTTFYYIIVKLLKHNKNLIIIDLLLFDCIYIFLCIKTGFDIYWYNTIFAYVFGVIYSNYENRINTLVNKNNKLLFVIVFIIMFIFYKINCIYSCLITYTLCSIIINILFIITINTIELKNRIFRKIGEISYEIYLLHGLFIKFNNFFSNKLLFIFFVFINSYIVSLCLHKVLNIIKNSTIKIL